MSRESWLLAARDLAAADFQAVGAPIPAEVRVAVGRTSKKTVLGECWSAAVSADAHREIWIKPYTDEPLDLIGVLVHELCHAALPHEVGHKKPFVTLARAMKLEGKPTATVVGEEFSKIWTPRLEVLGPYPGAIFNHLDADKTKNKPRPPSHLTFGCDCGMKFFMTPKLVAEIGAPRCVSIACDEMPQEIVK